MKTTGKIIYEFNENDILEALRKYNDIPLKARFNRVVKPNPQIGDVTIKYIAELDVNEIK